MIEPLKIDFQITLHDWLEFRRREQPAFQLLLLRFADSVWLPLTVLLATSLVLVLLILSNAAHVSFPLWVPIVILILLATCRVYLFGAQDESYTTSKEGMERNAGESRLLGRGLRRRLPRCRWSFDLSTEMGRTPSVFQSESLLIFCDEGMERALLIPKRAFISEQQFKEFLDLIYQRTVLDQKGPESTQSVG